MLTSRGLENGDQERSNVLRCIPVTTTTKRQSPERTTMHTSSTVFGTATSMPPARSTASSKRWCKSGVHTSLERFTGSMTDALPKGKPATLTDGRFTPLPSSSLDSAIHKADDCISSRRAQKCTRHESAWRQTRPSISTGYPIFTASYLNAHRCLASSIAGAN